MSWMGARFGMGNAYHVVLDRNALRGVQVPPSEYPFNSQAQFFLVIPKANRVRLVASPCS